MNASHTTIPPGGLTADGLKVGGWWHAVGDRIVCDLCPRACSLRDGDFGFVWLEITNLIIPDANDQRDDIRRMCEWIAQELGDEVPLHFSAF